VKREMLVDLNAIDSKRAEDIVLKANDIVDVPTSDKRRIINGLLGAVGPSAAYLPTRIVRPF
jgi:hypothetical protein